MLAKEKKGFFFTFQVRFVGTDVLRILSAPFPTDFHHFIQKVQQFIFGGIELFLRSEPILAISPGEKNNPPSGTKMTRTRDFLTGNPLTSPDGCSIPVLLRPPSPACL